MNAQEEMPVRIMDFEIDLEMVRESIPLFAPALGLSMTLPYLEPYLIKVMKQALEQTTDSEVAKEVKQFIGQEAQHFRQHAKINDLIRQCFPAYEGLREIENQMEADYKKFSEEKSLKFNLAYAEGFEAATCLAARSEIKYKIWQQDEFLRDSSLLDLFYWHLTEEVEHRTVTFNIYKHLYGDYFYRLIYGTFGQYHFFSYVFKFTKYIEKHYPGDKFEYVMDKTPNMVKLKVLKDLLGIYSPKYDPSKLTLPEDFQLFRKKYLSQANDIRTV